MSDKLTESTMCDTEIDITSDDEHKIIMINYNGNDTYVHSPVQAREFAQAILRAADRADGIKPEVAKPQVVKTA